MKRAPVTLANFEVTVVLGCKRREWVRLSGDSGFDLAVVRKAKRNRENQIGSRAETAQGDVGRVDMEIGSVVGDVQDGVGGIIDSGGKGVFRGPAIVDTDEDSIRLLHSNTCPIPIISSVAEREASTVEVDDARETVARILPKGVIVFWRQIEVQIDRDGVGRYSALVRWSWRSRSGHVVEVHGEAHHSAPEARLCP